MKTNLIALTVITTGVLFASCSKDEVPAPVTVQTKTVSNLQADTIIGIGSTGQPYGSGKYTLYSLESSSTIANTDSTTSKWDIGFRGTTIITNSGNSGPVPEVRLYTRNFCDLAQIPTDSTFRTDNAPTAMLLKLAVAMAGIVIMELLILLHQFPAAFW
jgi:hypothetical protein